MDQQTVTEKIKRLKMEKDAVILAHNYQPAEIQDIADFVGDSFSLSQIASADQSSVIIFCGVHFMAESAKILSPKKRVLLPVRDAGCPMADMINAEQLRKVKQTYPDAAVVCYVNSSAEVKAESTICCTSSNAVKVVESLNQKQIIFIPDKNLAQYVACKVPDKEIIIWEGYCPVHHFVKPKEIREVSDAYPQAKIMIHPECPPEICHMADFIGSTAQILDYIKKSADSDFIIGTEKGIIHTLQKENPAKKFYQASPSLLCLDMKKIDLQDVYLCLAEEKYEITINENDQQQAYRALQKMLEIM